MRKAITPIISIVILLFITVVLAGGGYYYLTTYSEMMTKVIDLPAGGIGRTG